MLVVNKARRSANQADASRLNGAKSSGATTPAGKLKIHHAHMTHGFSGPNVCVHTEDQDAFTAHINAYIARFAPIDKVELDLVSLIATNMWQVMRLTAVEVALADFDISNIESFYEGKYEEMDQYGRLALAFKKSAGDHAPELVLRYKTRAERSYHRGLQAIKTLQQNRPSLTPQEEISVTAGNPLPQPPKPHLQLVPPPFEAPQPALAPPPDIKSPPFSPPSNPKPAFSWNRTAKTSYY